MWAFCLCVTVQYILTRSYQTQLSCASYYIPVHRDKLLVTNTIDSIPYGNGIGNSHSMRYAIRA